MRLMTRMAMKMRIGSSGQIDPPWGSASRSRRDPFQLDLPAVRDAVDDARRAGEKARAVRPFRNCGTMYWRLVSPANPIRDPRLEPVPDLDPDLPLLDREEDQQPVVLPLLADAAAVVLEHLDGVLADVAVPSMVGTVATTTTSPLAALARGSADRSARRSWRR